VDIQITFTAKIMHIQS